MGNVRSFVVKAVTSLSFRLMPVDDFYDQWIKEQKSGERIRELPDAQSADDLFC